MSCYSPAKHARRGQRKKFKASGKAQRDAITAIIDSISFSISRDFRRHYRREDRLRTLDASPDAFSIHFPHNPFTVSIETVVICKGGTHAGWFSRGAWRNMIIMAKSQAKTENETEENVKVAQ